MEEWRKQFSVRVPRPCAAAGTAGRFRSASFGRKPDFTAISFKNFFDCFEQVSVSNNVFRVYLSGFDLNAASKPLLVLLHGGGYSGLTWAPFTRTLRQLCDCRVAAIDLRGHGDTRTENDLDLSIDTLCADVGSIINTLCANEPDLPPVVILGHSMGGALAVHCAHKLHNSIPSISGVVVIDVVEGTAMEALKNMKTVLRSRPKSFKSLQSAIEWCYCSGMTRNLEAAKVSMPGQLINVKTHEVATADIGVDAVSELSKPDSAEIHQWSQNSDKIEEEEENEDDNEIKEYDAKKASIEPKTSSVYTWRIDLENTEPYWESWFEGLSELFLSLPVSSKLLILAGFDRLDRTLTIGQMQGKFQTEVLSRCGHAAHEDDPDKVAEIVANFLRRNRILNSN